MCKTKTETPQTAPVGVPDCPCGQSLCTENDHLWWPRPNHTWDHIDKDIDFVAMCKTKKRR